MQIYELALTFHQQSIAHIHQIVLRSKSNIPPLFRPLSGIFRGIGLTTFFMIALITLGCQTPPEPCNCDQAEKELRAYTFKYFDALEDVGNLRQQLKACQEKR